MNLRALLELMRVSNLPTVWSNVVAGFFFGGLLASHSSWQLFDASNYLSQLQKLTEAIDLSIEFVLSVLGISLIYCGGMALNDYWDRDIDSIERPTRPIPSGRISASSAIGIAIALLLAGFALAGGLWHMATLLFFTSDLDWAQLPSLAALFALLACVVLYNRLHLAGPGAVLLMGLCRAFAFLVPALFMCKWFVLNTYALILIGPAATLFLYTVLISIVARREVEPGGPGKPRMFGGPKTIMNMIAAMPLLDAAWLVAMGLWPASLVCVGCSVLTKLGHRKVAGS